MNRPKLWMPVPVAHKVYSTVSPQPSVQVRLGVDVTISERMHLGFVHLPHPISVMDSVWSLRSLQAPYDFLPIHHQERVDSQSFREASRSSEETDSIHKQVSQRLKAHSQLSIGYFIELKNNSSVARFWVHVRRTTIHDVVWQ